MEDKMKQALLECCERNCEVLSPAVVAFMKDLTNTAIETSENKVDDMFVPIINMGFEVLDDYLKSQIDKIDGAAGWLMMQFNRLGRLLRASLTG